MLQIPLLNAFIFFICFCIVYKKKNVNKSLKFVVFEYLLSAITGWYFFVYGERKYYYLTMYGTFLFFCFFLVSLYPLSQVRIKDDKEILVNHKFMKCLGIVIFYGSILPMLDSLINLFDMLGNGNIAAYMINTHDARFVTTTRGLTNFICDLSIKTAYYCKAFLPLLLIYYLNHYKKVNKYVWGIIISQISLSVSSLVGSSRFYIGDLILTYIFTYFFMYNVLADYTKIFLKKLFLYGGAVILLILGTITIGRSISMGYLDVTSTFAWICLYTGEGMLNFNEFSIHDKVFQGIVTIFPILADSEDVVKMQAMTSSEFSHYWQMIWGHDANTFKSVFGDFVASFGVLNSFVYLTVFLLIFTKYIKKNILSFSNMALFITVMKFLYFGFMYFPYSGVSGNNYLLQALLAIIILKISEYYAKQKYRHGYNIGMR